MDGKRDDVSTLDQTIDVAGSGDPVLLIHGAVAEAYLPLIVKPILGRWQLIRYARPGYGPTVRPVRPATMVDEARHARRVLEHLGIVRAHVVGHSYGGAVALQLARDAPDMVASLSLLEPAIPSLLLSSPEMQAGIGDAVGRFQVGDGAGALDVFLATACGPEYRAALARNLPAGAFDRALESAETIFRADLPALAAWSFGPEEAAALAAPALIVTGADTLPVLRDANAQLTTWLLHADGFELPSASHLLMLQNPGDLANALADFFARHPICG